MSEEAVPLIELRDVTVRTGRLDILREVSLSFPEGGSTVLMGPSGCGKSTLLKAAAGLVPPDRGRVLYRGEDLFGLSEKAMKRMRRVNGFVFQDAALWENKTIYENLALPLEVHQGQLSRSEVQRRVMRVLERGGMEDSAGERPAQLSAGERKIVSFLRALVGEPALLFLDEPTSAVDPTMADRIVGMIRDVGARGCSILAVTTDRRLASTLADRLVVLGNGRVIASGPFDEVKRNPDPAIRSALAEVLGEIASFDTDLLSLLGGEGEN
jgi:ABC-type transporter Mla maintaining outer membrane lipid asymmetry ATPase subunit MlaF